MANNKSTAEQQTEVKELVVDAHFVMRTREKTNKVTGMTELQEVLAFELIKPFEGEDLKDVALKAKWDMYDKKTGYLVRSDRVFSCMSYYAKKALKTAAEVLVKVTIKPVTYKSKRTGKMVTYPGIFAATTFAELEDERPVELVVRGADEVNVFDMLASKALDIKFTPREDPVEEDIGL